MGERKRNFNLGKRTRRCCYGGIAMLALVGRVLSAEPPATPVTAPAVEAPSTARSPQHDSRPDVEARADFDTRPFASGDVWLPPLQAERDFPATFTPVPDLHSRAYLEDLSIPTMGGNGHGIRDQSPTEQLIRQVKKEGMPLARLWQNDQALVSLGLNRKGKPGLWIIQKTR